MSNGGAQSYAHDDRSDRVLVHVNGQLVPRDQVSVSIFDAGFGWRAGAFCR